eukprot:XP_022276351.1 guanine nucleotide-binding protein G(I)/G(S)/G(O) subunit gamma-12 isoform X1 [Canis lupus familiaris]
MAPEHRAGASPPSGPWGDGSRHSVMKFVPASRLKATVAHSTSDRFQVETRVEDVQQNSKHQQHRPGTENGATAENGSLHRENKGFKGISGPHVLL